MSSSRWILAVALAAGVATAPQLAAAEVTLNVRNAGELAALCAAKLPDIHYASKENFCHGFAQGVVSAEWERVRAAGAGAVRHFCTPTTGPSRAATLNEFVRWTDAKPGEKNGAPVATLVKFLAERYPCPTAAARPAPAAVAPAVVAPAVVAPAAPAK